MYYFQMRKITFSIRVLFLSVIYVVKPWNSYSSKLCAMNGITNFIKRYLTAIPIFKFLLDFFIFK